MSNIRRPLKSRGTAWAQSIAGMIARSGITPNQISVLGMVFALIAFFAFYNAPSSPALLFLAMACIQLRLLCNLMDGMVAVEHNRKSPLGDLYNEIPDRVADILILLGAGYFCRDIAWGVELGWLAALCAVLTAYIRAVGGYLLKDHYFLGPMAKPHRMALLTFGSVVTYFQMSFWSSLSGLWWILLVMNVGILITLYRRLARIADECRTKFS